jgi:hypothetical protein
LRVDGPYGTMQSGGEDRRRIGEGRDARVL